MELNVRQAPQPNTKIKARGTSRFIFVMIISTIVLILGLALSVSIGTASMPISEVFRKLWAGICSVFTGDKADPILFSIRVPRVLLALLLGGALSVSGYLLQVFFRNPVAGPFVLGISSGAKMLVGITLIFIAPVIGNMTSYTLVCAAFLGSLLITVAVLLLSRKVQNMSMLIVVGIMVGYICGAVTDLCITFASENAIVDLTGWTMGSFSGANWNDVKTALFICIPGVIAAMLISKPMSAYTLGEGYAKSMGVRIKLFRCVLILLSSILSACVTAIAGPISFVGIAVPHVTRALLKSSNPRFIIPTAFILGAAFCILSDLLARTVFAPTELAIGTVTAVFGAPIVIYMMLKQRKTREV